MTVNIGARMRAILAGTGAVAIAAGLLVASAPAAQAATHGHGIRAGDRGHIGSYLTESGEYVLCGEEENEVWPGVGESVQEETVSTWKQASGDTLAQVNWAIDQFANTDDYSAAAAQLFIWSAIDPGTFASKGGVTGYTSLMGDAGTTVEQYFNNITDASAAVTAATAPVEGSVEFVEGSTPATGTVTAKATGASSGTLTLTGATFEDGSSSKTVNLGETYKYTAPVAAPGASTSFSGTVAGTVKGYPAEVSVWGVADRGDAQKTLLGAGPKEFPWEFSGQARVDVPLPPVPTITTKAIASVTVGDDAHDVAIVKGEVQAGSKITFEAFIQKKGEKLVCDDTNKVFDTKNSPIEISKAGEYTSGKYTTKEVGNLNWIETLRDPSGKVIGKGECGTPNETTVVKPLPTITTKAIPSVTVGDKAHDVAIVTGEVKKGSTITFEAFIQKTGEKLVCEDANKVFDTKGSPIEISKAGEYTSEEYVTATVGNLNWIETLRDPSGKVIGKGDCGAPNETTVVNPLPPVPTTPPAATTPPAPSTPPVATPPLATTGADGMLPLGLGTAGVLLAAAVALLITQRVRAKRELKTTEQIAE
ncbi:hypothetical protein C5B85_00085 [Pseudoclavibacter sp. AY1F1]|uniref:hypothetical protein n=1 Tax=Pseudoclavibacter sp. AY1F1 TaxID=2080583 RepID=UPI000CE90069|nr:hypothetical protein [Pseudoclavibacter sp. AY1F1]PPF46733.1 hypothetical protein C5B85_00085 [Pseudoclavibacter sp. AY1F1]